MLTKVIIAFALIGQTMAATIAPAKTLLKHPERSNELTKQEIIERLSALDFYNDDNPTELVVQSIYKSKDDSEQLTSGLTFAELIAQNRIKVSECSKAALKKRVSVLEKVKVADRDGGVEYGVRIYLLDTLILAARFCLDHKNEIISHNINEESWMNDLDTSMHFDELHGDLDEDNETMEFWSQETVWAGFQSNVENFIKTDSTRFAHFKLEDGTEDEE